MKINIAILCFAFCYGAEMRAEISEARKREIMNDVEAGDYIGDSTSESQPFAPWIMSLSSEERRWVIPFARKKRDEWTDSIVFREAWNGVLAYLGDDDALRAHVAYSKANEYRQIITVQHAASGQVPLYFADGLFVEEPAEWTDSDGPMVPRSVRIASFILGYLHYNKHYSQEVRDWAGRTERNHPPLGEDLSQYREVVRKWYRANEAYIRSEEYEKVMPGEELPPMPRDDETGARRIELNSRNVRAIDARTAAQVAAPVPAILDHERTRWRMYLAAGLVAFACVIASALVWHRRRFGRSPSDRGSQSAV